MQLVLFLGSGISFPSGLPGVAKITDSVLNETWFHHTDGRFLQGPPVEFRPNDPTPILQEFLKRLKPYADLSHPLTGQAGNYEDLFFLAEQIAADAQSHVDNPAIGPFVLELRENTKDLTDRLHKSVGELANLACDLIRSVAHQKLASVGAINGLELVESLAISPSIQSLDIVTLNHDLLIERLLTQRNITFVDGFGAAEGNVRYFAPTLFESRAKVRLFKLHGSINWYRFRGEAQNPFSDRYGIPVHGDPDHCRDGHRNLLTNIDTIPWILAGTHGKPIQYNFGIFAEMHFWFHRLLKEHDTIAMSGYGWSDRGINGRLIEWLHSSRQPRLLLMHQKLEELVSYSKGTLWCRYEPLVKAGRILPIPKWMQEVTLTDFLANFGEDKCGRH